MQLSIRHDVSFQDALVAYSDAQNELYTTPEEESSQPEKDKMRAEQSANIATRLLCDCIDHFAERMIRCEVDRMQRQEAEARRAKRAAKAA